jgi:hypothetical protein
MREGKNMGIMITLKKTYPRKGRPPPPLPVSLPPAAVVAQATPGTGVSTRAVPAERPAAADASPPHRRSTCEFIPIKLQMYTGPSEL